MAFLIRSQGDSQRIAEDGDGVEVRSVADNVRVVQKRNVTQRA